MAAFDATRSCNLQVVEGISTRRTIRAHKSDAPFPVSIPSNIAEGQGRSSAGEFKQFLGIARGSNYEVQTQLELAKAFGFAKLKAIETAEGLSHEVGRMIYALIESL